MNQLVQKLIEAHKKENERIEIEKGQPHIKVSKLASFFATVYEGVRNVIEEEQAHLLRKRAIKRILKRMKALENPNPEKVSRDLAREIIWAKYLQNVHLPASKTKYLTVILKKYSALATEYKKMHKKELTGSLRDFLYSLIAIEIERTFIPHNAQDVLIELQYNFLKNKGILDETKLPKGQEAIQTYIASHRANIKSDDEIILFHLFYLKFPYWGTPNQSQLMTVAKYLDNCYGEIHSYLKHIPSKKRYKEVIKQSIPFKILDKVIKTDPKSAASFVENEDERNRKIEQICGFEYQINKSVLARTIIGSIIYIFITKILLALFIEVPYELQTHGEVNYITLAINILFPTFTMFVVANSFSIPNKENTEQIKKMISAIVSVDRSDDVVAFDQIAAMGTKSKYAFKIIYYSISTLIFAGIVFLLNLLNYNPVGMVIFLIFFSTIFFMANKLRNTASELKVVNTSPSVFSPLIDMLSLPILILGKYLSEGAARLNLFVLIFDYLIERPVKNSIKGFEQWNDYIRETKEEII